MDEDLDLEKRAIEELPVVSSVRFHAGDKTHKANYHVNLRCGCGAKQVGPIRMSSKFPTLCDCLREFGRRIDQYHGPTCVAAAQNLQAPEKDAADASTKRSHECQESRFRSGTPHRVLTTQALRWQCSSTRASCAPRTSPSRK
jgi:hypothetical protein